ncbi:hypothetical protein [Halomonas caseinilytica]|uniref:hypothetical protein n=1 Tax=Halomonas caseinilytica TaxID=438744 RepID=UPI0010BEEB83|nr:hypothetical protein [Halomonas caseinilytica]
MELPVLTRLPQNRMTVQTVKGTAEFTLSFDVWAFASLLFMEGIALGFGKVSMFKRIASVSPSAWLLAPSACSEAWVASCCRCCSVCWSHRHQQQLLHAFYGVICVSLLWMHFIGVHRSDYFTHPFYTPISGPSPVRIVNLFSSLTVKRFRRILS